jgi:hypothetical protein
MRDALDERRKALENEFFQKRDHEMLERLRQDRERAARREELAHASGIEDPSLLNRLLEQGVEPDSLSALVVTPLVLVAWADGSLKAAERKEVLDAAHELGVARGGAAHALLDDWLDHQPKAELGNAWVAYTQAVVSQLHPYDRARLAEHTLERARRVARAAGGVLGLGPHTSKAERAVLEKLEEALLG